MRHTAFLVLGEDSSNISADIKKYVLGGTPWHPGG